MTDEELEELITTHPYLYHMAEDGSWQTIQEHGLLSTSAILDALELDGEQRHQIESVRRPETVLLEGQGNNSFLVRDQKPMGVLGTVYLTKNRVRYTTPETAPPPKPRNDGAKAVPAGISPAGRRCVGG